VIQPFDDPEAVLAEANDSDYGLAASLWTNNLKVGLDLAHRLEAGLVQINQNLVVQANLSYGGVKQSGLGKEASLEAMLEHFHSQEDHHGELGLTGEPAAPAGAPRAGRGGA
jgi:acyl-CoA reductase-like NAD-dependent aldehyde dehydrogenase